MTKRVVSQEFSLLVIGLWLPERILYYVCLFCFLDQRRTLHIIYCHYISGYIHKTFSNNPLSLVLTDCVRHSRACATAKALATRGQRGDDGEAGI